MANRKTKVEKKIRIKKKLTAKLKDQIKAGDVKKDQVAGEALIYLNRLAALKKARAAKKNNIVKAGQITIRKGDPAFNELTSLAKRNGMTLKQYVKKHKDAIEKYLSGIVDYEFPTPTDGIKLIILSMRYKSKFNLDGHRMSKDRLLLNMDLVVQKMFEVTDAFLLKAKFGQNKTNSFIDVLLPSADEVSEIEDEEEFENLINSYGAVLIRSRAKYEKKFGAKK